MINRYAVNCVQCVKYGARLKMSFNSGEHCTASYTMGLSSTVFFRLPPEVLRRILKAPPVNPWVQGPADVDKWTFSFETDSGNQFI